MVRSQLSHNALMYVNYIFIDDKMLRKGKQIKLRQEQAVSLFPLPKETELGADSLW